VTAAEAYEQFLVPAIFEPWALNVLRAHPPPRGSRVLDIACGTGIGARSAAGLVGPAGRVDGVDADDAMLAVARAARPRPGSAPVAWHHASALNLPFADGAFDAALCFEGLQFFPDRAAALREVRRALRAGAAFLATVWGPLEQNPAYEALALALRDFVSEAAARLPPFALTDADTIRSMVRAAGFAEISVTLETLTLELPSAEDLVDWVAAGGPTMRHSLAMLPAERRREFSSAVAARLERYRNAGGLAVPSARNVIAARAAG